jgi:hypothetical protein
MTTNPQLTSTLFFVRPRRYRRPCRAPNLAQLWLGTGAVQTLGSRGVGGGRGDVASRTPGWCTACLLGL